MQKDRRLQQMVKLVGEDSLPDDQKLALFGARLWREAFLQQNAFDPIDRYTTPEKQVAMMKVLQHWIVRASDILKSHIPFYRVRELPVTEKIARMKAIPNEELDTIGQIVTQIDAEMNQLEQTMQE